MTLLAAVLCSLAVAADLGAVPRASAGSLSLKGNTVATSPGQWTWAGGPDRIAEFERVGVYGTKGVAAPENVPGARSGAATWVDTSGNFWLFGGRGFARHALLGTLNDLWKWDGASWTWVSGSDTYGRRGTYGEKGVAAPGNEPGARSDAVSWIDSAGNLWLFGGHGRDSASSYNVSLSDLWKWDGSDWTWVSGPIVGSRQGVYGTLGVAAPENCPGARYGATHWSGGDGSFWLFGGNGYGMSQYSSGLLNDLWKWNGSAWSWMGGSSGVNQPGVYGTKGIANPANVPGGRRNASANVGPDGTILLFGGYGQSVSGSGYLNDLWRWDGAEWIWVNGSDVPNQPGVYGTRGVPAPENVPGAREGSVAWMDGTGRFFLLGGFYSPTSNSWASLSDLWMWNGAGWVWVGGTSTPNQTGSYGVRGVPAAGNEPGARNGASAARDALGGVYVFGGDGASSTGSIGALNDFWRWNGSEWAWLSGTNGATLVGVYGTKGLASPTSHPGARRGAVTWLTANGETWLFGGHGYSAAGLGYLNDLWRWDGSSWTWMSGTNLEDQPAISGTKGIPAAENVPGARAWGVSWADSAGNLWLFGGRTPDVYDDGLLNDLWRWDGTNWTWVSGSLSPWKQGIYGTKGVPAPSNVPGSRSELTAWADATGNFWLFGGYGMAGGWFGDLNDLWRWDGTNWTWMHGSNDTDDSGSGGVLGEPSATNTPAARTGAIGSAAPDGTAWVHGGASGDYWLMDDLWRWDGTYWTRMSGTGTYFANGVYGEKGVAAPGNRPGARAWGASWADARGHFWLFGGSRSFGAGVYLNDLWRWDGVNWTWMSGSDAANASGVYGVAGTPAAGNSPGARDTAFAWKGNDGNFWIMNGFGADSAGVAGRLADLWAYEPPACSPPSATITAPDWILEGSGSHSASVANAGDGFTYEWTITGGTIDGGQGTPAVTISATAGESSVVLAVVVQKGDCATSREKTILVGLYHRLVVVRNGSSADRVSSGSPGYEISCGTSCSALYGPGTSVTLFAYPGPNSRFAGWVGGGCSGTESCVVTMNESTMVSATFLQKAAAGFFPVSPCRIADTRNPAGHYGAPALEAGASRSFTVGGTCGVPADAAAVALNVTVTAPTDAGSLTLFPGTGPAPDTGVVSFATGRTRASSVTMGLVGGVLSVLDRQETGTVDLILDVNGYFR